MLSLQQLLKIGNLFKKNCKTKQAIEIFERCISQMKTSIAEHTAASPATFGCSVDATVDKQSKDQAPLVKCFAELRCLEDYRVYYNLAGCYCDLAVAASSSSATATAEPQENAFNTVALKHFEHALDLCAHTLAAMEPLWVPALSQQGPLWAQQLGAAFPQTVQAKACLVDIWVSLTGIYIKCQQPIRCVERCVSLLENAMYSSGGDAASGYMVTCGERRLALPFVRPPADHTSMFSPGSVSAAASCFLPPCGSCLRGGYTKGMHVQLERRPAPIGASSNAVRDSL